MREQFVTVRDVTYYIRERGEGIPLVFLHGFLGDGTTFSEVIKIAGLQNFRIIQIDLLGHGNSSKISEASRYFEEEQVKDLDVLFRKLAVEKPIIAGYSMGGRLAISYASQFSEKIRGLFLESTTPGMENRDEREVRLENDIRLAKQIFSYGLEDFVAEWNQLPLFTGLRKLDSQRKKQLNDMKVNQTKFSIAASLSGFSTGRMNSHWKNLVDFSFPIQIIVGKNDLKFLNIAQKMHNFSKNSKVSSIENCYHVIHIEKNEEYAQLLAEFCSNFSSIENI